MRPAARTSAKSARAAAACLRLRASRGTARDFFRAAFVHLMSGF